jgi:hypothetical protein
MKIPAALCLGLFAPLFALGGDIDGLLSDADLHQSCAKAIEGAAPNLRSEGMQFLVMQSAVKRVEPRVAYAFYQDSRHSRHFLMDMLSTWSELCSDPDNTLQDAASVVAYRMDATLQRAMPGYASTYSGHGN